MSPGVVESGDMMIWMARIEDFKEDSSVVSLCQNDKNIILTIGNSYIRIVIKQYTGGII